MVSKQDLKSAGLKVTLPRLRVLEVLRDAEGEHVSAEEVYKRLLNSDEAVGLATVYRVLTQFHSAGIVDRHHFDDNHAHAVYELSPDEHHDHMIDVDTGEITEFVNGQIEQLQEQIARDSGYELVDHELVLYVRKRPDS
ncbi:MAG: ferric iron uptake transcriptional regulator [Pseudomonadales bacterium]|nr:ferric iron uptake transcriptional regulator [Pseudomonadales bacterium]